MRLGPVLVCLLLVGCVGPHSTGGLWAQQNVEQELLLGRSSEAERADRAHAYELMLGDQALSAERARVADALQDCPGVTREPLELSSGDRVRDPIRVRAADDPQRRAAVAQVALADWRVRRARATGDAQFCDAARLALTQSPLGEPTVADVLAGLGSATVVRDAQRPVTADVAANGSSVRAALSSYAMGAVDTLRAPAPLPQYLAAIYGGVVVQTDHPPALNGETPEMLVDRLAPQHPDWEPDAIFEALQAA